MAIRSCTSSRGSVKVVTPRKEMHAIGTTTLSTMKSGRRLTHARRWTAQKRRLVVAPTVVTSAAIDGESSHTSLYAKFIVSTPNSAEGGTV